jgi:restriction system protein
MAQSLSKSKALAAKVIYAAFSLLRENNSELPISTILEEIPKRVTFSEWDLEMTNSNSRMRWNAMLSWYSVDCVKAGFLLKNNGTWYLTPEGEKEYQLGEIGLIEAASKGYRTWKAQHGKSTSTLSTGITSEPSLEEPSEASEINAKQIEITLQEMRENALGGIKAYIGGLNAYEFQDLAAALLRGMGYYTPFIAPKGKDGGIDIIAYRDPLGATVPRIKVQVKHRGDSARSPELQQLLGILNEGTIGIFISSGGFTPDAKTVARTSHKHIELIDLQRFIELWQEFYPKLSDSDKRLLPLEPVWFLAPQG